MRLLLDTQVFLWFLAGDTHLPAHFRTAIGDRSNEVFLSVASVWEAVIKYALGKLPLPEAPAQYLPRQRIALGISSLPMDEGALRYLASLPSIHSDPFDRLLIAQSLQFACVIMTVDREVLKYPATFFT